MSIFLSAMELPFFAREGISLASIMISICTLLHSAMSSKIGYLKRSTIVGLGGLLGGVRKGC
jgi:hypothetical protein